ncbi:unnamed protein product, partial [Brenthis ino]
MYRVLVIFLIFTATEGFRCRHQPRHFRHPRLHKHYHQYPRLPNHRNIELFADISRKLRDIDIALHDTCKQNENRTKEIYGSNYVLKYNLPEYKNPNISVKINNRVISTIVEANGKKFEDVRILPEILKHSQVLWLFDDDELKVVIPYKNNLGEEVPVQCKRIYGVIDIPSINEILSGENISPNSDSTSIMPETYV